jgi:hypothetical protein
MDRRERYRDPEEPFRIFGDAMKSNLWTALPGIIVSFDAALQTAVVQPAIKQVLLKEGATRDLPVLGDVPVYFPSGGGLTLTFPITEGDECLLVFASRCIDAWWQSGGTQPPGEARTHSLSDGFALVGIRSTPRALDNVSTSAVQLRTDAGGAYIELQPSGKVRIIAPEGVDIVGNVSVSGNIAVTGGNVSADGITLKTHKHSGVAVGGGQSGPAVP